MVHFNIWIQPRLVFSCEFTCISLKRKQCKRAESSSFKSNPADKQAHCAYVKRRCQDFRGDLCTLTIYMYQSNLSMSTFPISNEQTRSNENLSLIRVLQFVNRNFKIFV